MASDALLLLVGVPENYRQGGPAFQRLHRAHPRVQVRIVHDLSAFAEQVPQADALIGSRPYLKLSPEVLKPGGRLRWVQTTTAGVDQVITPGLLAADHVTITCIKGPPGPLMAEHAVLLTGHGPDGRMRFMNSYGRKWNGGDKAHFEIESATALGPNLRFWDVV